MKRLSMAMAAGLLAGATGVASAQGTDYLSQNREVFRAYSRHTSGDGVTVDNRCRGISYGTGARSCGTATGGPVGGIGGRN